MPISNGSPIGEHTYGTWQSQAGWQTPLRIARAEGMILYDDEGNGYYDLSSQLVCSNLGHSNRPIADAISKQATTLPYIFPGFSCATKEEAVQSLLSVMPEGLNQFYFSTSGALANEAAIRIIQQFKKPEGNYKIISRYRSYHGSTSGSIGLTGEARRWHVEPTGTLQGTVFAPDPYCYRCPFELDYPQCGLRCAEYIEFMIEQEGNVAAIIAEPVVGANGVIVPPPDYFPRLRSIADKHKVLLVVDEVMSGWWRTGRAFAIEHWNVLPDIITTAKGCTAAYTPVGLTITTSAIREFFADRFLPIGHTYSMHPLTVAAIPPAIAEYKRLESSGLPQRVSRYLETSLQELADRHRCIGDVRGLGHFWAIELVQDRAAKTPFDVNEPKTTLKPPMTARLNAEMLKRGLYVIGRYNYFIIAPPLIATEEDIDHCLDIIDGVLPVADQLAA